MVVLFHQYIVGACFRKILYRLQHDISKPILNSLMGISTFNYSQTPCSSSDRDHDFLLAILSFQTTNAIPNLNKQAQAALDHQPFEIYTEETHTELHALLCELLERFEASLELLAGYHTPAGTPENYRRDLHVAASIGYVLFRLARSAAIEKHFKAIEPLLTNPRCDKANDVRGRLSL